MSKITLILVGDDANLEASRRSLSDFKKFNGNKSEHRVYSFPQSILYKT